jgi:DtxR family Mn-dependent transcriptional regulator
MSEVSAVIEEYLECIYRFQEKKGVARTNDIVKSLRVVPGTVTNIVERLEKEGYVTHEPYKGVKLTERGVKVALQVIRRHRLSECLLSDVLHLEWYRIHEFACKLEHSMPDEILNPLEEALGHPKTCPHGNPIPTKNGIIFEEESQPLFELAEGECGTVVKITEENTDLLNYLNQQGLIPGVQIELVEKAPFNGPIVLKIGTANRSISRTIASIIRINRKSKNRGC